MRFFQIATGSAHEVENHLLIASDLGYIGAAYREQKLGELKSIQRMLASLMRNLPD